MTPRSSEKPGEPLLKISIQPDGNPEIFYSIQGEGVNIGVPTVFLRLALCNLRCDWCDTKYTWDWDQYEYEKEVRDMSLSAVEEEIRRFGCRHLVITGGEPLMQARQMVPLAQSLKKLDYFIEVETNGTLVPPREFSSWWTNGTCHPNWQTRPIQSSTERCRGLSTTSPVYQMPTSSTL